MKTARPAETSADGHQRPWASKRECRLRRDGLHGENGPDFRRLGWGAYTRRLSSFVCAGVIIALALAAIALPPVCRAAGDPDGLDANVAGGVVRTVVTQLNGSILLGGTFSSVQGVPRSNLARLSPDGQLDLTFNPVPNGEINCIAIEENERIVIGGASRYCVQTTDWKSSSGSISPG